LESSKLTGASKILPGTLPTSQKDIEVGVYPNPYYGEAMLKCGEVRETIE